MRSSVIKRSIAIILCLCMVVPLVPLSALASDTEMPLYGDADGNGKVELDDLLAIEKYVAGSGGNIDMVKADVNADGVVDDTDVEMLRQYLVGNIELPTELCTITFDSDGGDEVAPIKVGKGNVWKGEIASPSSEAGYFTGWLKPDGTPFYQNEPITSDITLKASYGNIPSVQALYIDSFALVDQEKNLSLSVNSDLYSAAEQAKAHIRLIVKDGSSPVGIKVTGSNGAFTVTADGGFNAGCSYELILDDGINFNDKEPTIRKAAIVIKRDEVDKLKYNDKLIFIKDTDKMTYNVNGRTTDVLEAGFLNNTGSSDSITGTFTLENGSLKAGDYVCIYEKTDPRSRDYTDNLYENDALAYVQIINVSNNTYSFRSLTEEDAEDILLMPETVPFLVTALPGAGSTGTVNKNSYDHDMWSKLGNTVAPEYNEGDLIVFYTVPSSSLTAETPCRYAKILSTDASNVDFLVFPEGYGKDEIGDYIAQEFFVSFDIDGTEIIDELNDKDKDELLNNISNQAFESGFVADSMNVLLQNALNTDTIYDSLRGNGLTDEEIGELKYESIVLNDSRVFAAAGSGAGKGGRVKLVVEGFSVVPTFIYGDRYDKGIGIVLDISVQLSVDKKMSPTRTISLKIELGASFEQQIYISLNVGADTDIDWYVIYPDIKEFTVKTTFDIKSYTSVSVYAKMYTVQDTTSKAKWTALTQATASPNVQKALRELNRLGVLIKKAKKSADALNEYKEQFEDILDKLPKVNVGGQEYSIEELEAMLGKQDVASEFDEVLSAEDETGNKVGIEQIMDKYKEMLDTECDWVQLFNRVLFEKEFHIKIVAIKFTVSFVVTANVNVALGADLEYEMGKRYSFWIDIVNARSGSSEMDLLDERFGFQFYVMGTLGLKAGVKLDVAIGIISTKIGSVGANVEVGPYLKLYGYFFYIYTKHRPMNTQDWDITEEMQGALYIEFGIYLTVRFKAQIFEETFKYETTLYSTTFPLLIAGVKTNVYNFAAQPGKNDILYIDDSDGNTATGVTMKLPESYLLMRTIDMMTGERVQLYYPLDKFAIRFSDSRFSIDEDGIISVSGINEERYIECNMYIVWKCDKLAFSKYDIDITVPIVWTLMSETERTEKFTAAVAVGNINDGYNIIWSNRYTRFDSFDLPSVEEILDTIDYHSYDFDGFNLKYSAIPGYKTDKTEGLKLIGDTTYYFDITPGKYTATVNGIVGDDGTVTSKTYTVPFGGSFDFSELAGTGENNPEKGAYSSFDKLIVASDSDAEPISQLDANLFFYTLYGTDVDLTASYIDDSRTATFEFKGINAPAVQKQFRRGTVPDMSWISEYIAGYGGDGTSVIGISPEAKRTETSITYIVSCMISDMAQRYKVNYVSDIDLGYASHEHQVGSAIFAPTNPSEAGYIFDGWYGDAERTEPFDFSIRMPDHDITVYAKWTKKQYNITLISQGNTVGTVTAAFSDHITTLTNPEKQSDIAFTGWYTSADGGNKISNGDIYTNVGNITLYAHWVNKSAIDISSAISYTAQQTTTYNEGAHTFAITDNLFTDGNGFIIWYKNEKPNYDWTNIAPVNAGTYEVAISRDTDDTYLKLDRTVLPAAKLIIDKAALSLSGGNVFTEGGVLTMGRPDGIKGNGIIQYSIKNTLGSYSKSQSSPYFANFPKGSYVCSVEVLEGDNYKPASLSLGTHSVSGYIDMKYDVYIRIKTNGTALSDTDEDVFADLKLLDGTFITKLLDKSGHNDFMLGANDEYFICTVSAPWQIQGYRIRCGADDSLRMKEVTIRAKSQNTNHQLSKTTNSDNNSSFPVWVGVSDYTDDIYINTFDRNTTSFGNFDDYNGKTINLDDSEDFNFEFNGMLRDSEYGLYKSTFYYDPARITVTSDNESYNSFIRFTGVSSFTIDKEGLAHYIAMNGGSDFNYYVTLRNDDMTGGFVRQISLKVNVPEDLPYSMNPEHNVKSSSLLSLRSEDYLSFAGTAPEVDLSELRLTANRGDEFELPIRVSSESAWGVLSETTFDTSALELIGWSLGDAADEEFLTVQNDMSKGEFRILFADNQVRNTPLKGTLVTLRFKAKADAPSGDSKVTFNTIRALTDTGDTATVGAGAGTVNIPSPIVPNTADAFDVVLWSGLAVISVAGFVITRSRRKKSSRM